jgi:RNA polymerase sigma-70 factor (ECF subfamily)
VKDLFKASVNPLENQMAAGSITDSQRLGKDPGPGGRPTFAPVKHDADLDLLQCFAQFGDTDAFAQLVQRYGNFVYATCLRVLGNSARAEDVCQETFFKLMRRPHEVNQNVGAWLHRTATHLALDALRSDSSRKRREIAYTQQVDRSASTWSELSPAVDQALSELPDELRTLLVRHFLLGHSQAELAAESDQSPATISRRMRQALEELRQHLRLKGIQALSVTLAALLCHVSARQAPASLMRELGKMTMVSGARTSAHLGAHGAPVSASVAAKGGATGLSRISFRPPQTSTLAKIFSVALKSQLILVLAGMIGALVALQFVTGAWTLPAPKSQPVIEPDTHMSRPQGAMSIEGLDPVRQSLIRVEQR